MQPIKGNSGIGNTLVIGQKFLLKIKMYNYQPLTISIIKLDLQPGIAWTKWKIVIQYKNNYLVIIGIFINGARENKININEKHIKFKTWISINWNNYLVITVVSINGVRETKFNYIIFIILYIENNKIICFGNIIKYLFGYIYNDVYLSLCIWIGDYD